MTATALPTTRIGRGGWVRLLMPEPSTPVAYVRFQATASGRLDLHDVFVDAPDAPLPLDTLRKLPLERLVVWANSQQVAPQIVEKLHDPCPAPSTDLAFFDLDVHAEAMPEGVEGTWVEASRRAQAEGDAQVPRPRDQELESRTRAQSTLSIPTSRPFPDSFYEEVAALYRHATLESSKPVAAIAKAHGVKASTVHGWVARARERGYLESSGQGRVA